MSMKIISRVVAVALLCFCVSCSSGNEGPECDAEITLLGVKEALYQSIAQGGNPYLFKSALYIDSIESVDSNEDEQECSARLFVLKKYQTPFHYKIAVEENEYYVVITGLDQGTKDNIYKVINNMKPNLVGDQ